MKNILIVENDPLILKYVTKITNPFGRVFTAQSLQGAVKALKETHIDYALVDLNLSEKDQFEGLEVISMCNRLAVECSVLTSHSEKEVIKKCFEAGANSYFTKESLEKELSLHLTQHFMDAPEEFFKNSFITKDLETKEDITKLMKSFHNTDINNLITGETGSGKTHLIKSLHSFLESKTPLIVKNLREISPQLIESELFGHRKGAFTGANDDRVGLLSKANGGLLFLDEIGVLPLSLQEKLLSVIETKTFTPVGSNNAEKVNFKLITATCDDLKSKIESGDFRLDFYHRIHGECVHLKPLRKRSDDIAGFIDYIVSKSTKKIAFSDEALTEITTYKWPGNLRELKSYILSLLSTHSGLVNKTNLNVEMIDDKKELFSGNRFHSILKDKGLPHLLKVIEKEALQKSQEKLGDQVNKIVEDLKISKSVFYRILKESQAI